MEEFKVYCIVPSNPWTGGNVLVAAKSKKEALEIVNNEDYDISRHFKKFIDSNGVEHPRIKEIEVLFTKNEKPGIILNSLCRVG